QVKNQKCAYRCGMCNHSAPRRIRGLRCIPSGTWLWTQKKGGQLMLKDVSARNTYVCRNFHPSTRLDTVCGHFCRRSSGQRCRCEPDKTWHSPPSDSTGRNQCESE